MGIGNCVHMRGRVSMSKRRKVREEDEDENFDMII